MYPFVGKIEFYDCNDKLQSDNILFFAETYTAATRHIELLYGGDIEQISLSMIGSEEDDIIFLPEEIADKFRVRGVDIT